MHGYLQLLTFFIHLFIENAFYYQLTRSKSLFSVNLIKVYPFTGLVFTVFKMSLICIRDIHRHTANYESVFSLPWIINEQWLIGEGSSMHLYNPGGFKDKIPSLYYLWMLTCSPKCHDTITVTGTKPQQGIWGQNGQVKPSSTVRVTVVFMWTSKQSPVSSAL